MKFVQFVYKDKPDFIRWGYMECDGVVDINKLEPELPSTLIAMLRTECTCKLNRLIDLRPPVESISNVTLLAPITGMDKIICAGLNYRDTCEELKKDLPAAPMFFSKFASCIIGPNEPLRLKTDWNERVDWEVEMAFVMGLKCSGVKATNALKYVLGYTVAQDISSREWVERNAGQLLLAKCQDNFCPIGPCIVTSDEIGDPQNLEIMCSVNGVEKQHSNTSKMVHKVPDIIERLSSLITLLPGDLVLTGTPGGVGSTRTPPEYLKPGDVLRSEIQNIGAFEVRVEKYEKPHWIFKIHRPGLQKRKHRRHKKRKSYCI